MVKHFATLMLAITTISSFGNEKLMDAILNVGAGGIGNEKIIQHWDAVNDMSSSDLIKLFKLMNRSNDLGDNWIRAAIFQIIENSGDDSFPTNETVNFIKNNKNSGSARRTAYEFLSSISSQIAQSLIPNFIDDPEPSLRREGVELLLEQADALKNQKQSIEAYEYALSKAREADQIEKACKSLENLGEKIDLQKLMGFVIQWEVVGPFQNKDRKGFGIPYTPEKSSTLPDTNSLNWQTISTTDRFGLIDLNDPFGFIKEVLCYAKSEFESPINQAVQFRFGSKNAWKLWVNGKLVFERDEYHRGKTRVDQFVLDGNLNKGKNQILLKICQNEQTQTWTKQWEFCLRITDPTGKPILSSQTP